MVSATFYTESLLQYSNITILLNFDSIANLNLLMAWVTEW